MWEAKRDKDKRRKQWKSGLLSQCVQWQGWIYTEAKHWGRCPGLPCKQQELKCFSHRCLFGSTSAGGRSQESQPKQDLTLVLYLGPMLPNRLCCKIKCHRASLDIYESIDCIKHFFIIVYHWIFLLQNNKLTTKDNNSIASCFISEKKKCTNLNLITSMKKAFVLMLAWKWLSEK